MAYKDKDKQREANRERQRRYKARSKALAKGVTSEGVTKGVTVTGEEVVIPEGVVEFNNVEALLDDLHDTKPVIPKSESHVDASDIGAVKTLHRLIKALPIKPERTAQGNIRVSKPGDADYEPQCETTRAFIEGRDKRPEVGKRGKDIKSFEDLSPSIQRVIDVMSDDKTEHKRRTAIAINYQHLFPDRFHSTGVI